MHHLVHMLSSIKLGLQHKVPHVRCQRTRLNEQMLAVLMELGLVESVHPCPRYRFKRVITLHQVDGVLLARPEGYLRVLGLTSVAYAQWVVSTFEICVRRNRPWVISHRGLRRAHQANELRTSVVSTSRGLMTHREALRARLGGVMVCRLF